MKSVPVIAVSLWLGAMALLAFVVAPAAFATLEREAAGRLVSAVFPRYYAAGLLLGVLALGGIGWRWWAGGWRFRDGLALALVLVMLGLTLYAWAVVLPQAHAAREALRQTGAASTDALRFARLHRLSSVLNAMAMVTGIALLVVEAWRRP